MDEHALIASCQAGRLQDFDPLYQQYVKPIFGFVYRRTLVRETAEDIVSTTFLKALERIGLYDAKKGPFSAWLYSIARNTLTDHYRRSRDVQNIEDVWDLPAGEILPKLSEHRTDFEQIKKALDKLDPEKREIILLRIWDGLSYKEIASITGKSEGNCKMIFSRTISSLRNELSLALFLLLLTSPFRP